MTKKIVKLNKFLRGYIRSDITQEVVHQKFKFCHVLKPEPKPVYLVFFKDKRVSK